MKTKVYVSGPMTGIKNLNIEAFEIAEKRLLEIGYDVVNPHKVCENVEPKTWNACMRADIKALMDCDEIYLLAGYSQSRGAMIERDLAKKLGMRVGYE